MPDSNFANLSDFLKADSNKHCCLLCLVTLNQKQCFFSQLDSTLDYLGYPPEIKTESTIKKHSLICPFIFSENATHYSNKTKLEKFFYSSPEILNAERSSTLKFTRPSDEETALHRATSLKLIPLNIGLALSEARFSTGFSKEKLDNRISVLQAEVQLLRNEIGQIRTDKSTSKEDPLTDKKLSKPTNINVDNLTKQMKEIAARLGSLETTTHSLKNSEPSTPRTAFNDLKERVNNEAQSLASLSVRMDEQARTNQWFSRRLSTSIERDQASTNTTIGMATIPNPNVSPTGANLPSPPVSPKSGKTTHSREANALATHIREISAPAEQSSKVKHATSSTTIDTWEKSTQDSNPEDDESDNDTVRSGESHQTVSTTLTAEQPDQSELFEVIADYKKRNHKSVDSSNLEYWLDFLHTESKTFRELKTGKSTKDLSDTAHQIFMKRIYSKKLNTKQFRAALESKIKQDMERRLQPKPLGKK